MNKVQGIKNILKVKERILNSDTVEVADVNELLSYIDSITTDNDTLKYHLKVIYSVLEHADEFSLQDDLWDLEKDFEYLEEFA